MPLSLASIESSMAWCSMAAEEETRRFLVVTDLDGTLLDAQTYSWAPAAQSLEKLRQKACPLILNSSKTLAELLPLARELKTDSPLIAENGSVIAIPEAFTIRGSDPNDETQHGHRITRLGLDRKFIIDRAHQLRRDNAFKFEGFSDWTSAEIADRTGLELSAAENAAQRWATEPILWHDSTDRWDEFARLLANQAIRAIRGGRFTHLMGEVDKATSLNHVRLLYQQAFPHVAWEVVALGDAPNDLDMLSAADIAVVIPNQHSYTLEPTAARTIFANAFGPSGWNQVMLQLIHELDS